MHTSLHDDTFLKILWDGNTRVIGIDWKEATSPMTALRGDDLRGDLSTFFKDR